eukprot:8467062-Pyramimonas_sp.AAC.1
MEVPLVIRDLESPPPDSTVPLSVWQITYDSATSSIRMLNLNHLSQTGIAPVIFSNKCNARALVYQNAPV